MIEFRPLTGVPFATIHRAFLEAFSDYSVPLQLSEADLREMVIRRGFEPEISLGAFQKGELIAFTLNGSGSWLGRKTAYDTGTGVIPSHRGRGIGRAMIRSCDDLLRSHQFEQYLLEVIQTNEAAVELYRGSGFEVTRELQCFSFAAPESRSRPAGLAIEVTRELPPWNSVTPFRDVAPSWQNSDDSLRRARGERLTLTATLEGVLAGYAVLFTANGDLPQLAVAQPARRRGVGSALLAEAFRVARQPLRIVNIDVSEGSIGRFLEASGATPTVAQFEMIRPLKAI